MDRDTRIRAIVDKHEAVYRGDSLYNSAITDMATVDLANISESDVVCVVEHFLYDWGKMGRVLGQERFLGRQGKVTQIIKSNSELLRQFQKRNVEYEDLSNHMVFLVKIIFALWME